MKPAPFTYHRASSVDDALSLLAEHPDAKPLAGGQSLIPAMNFRLAQPKALVDLNAVSELQGITATADGGLRIGAMTRHLAVERSAAVARAAPLLSEAMPHVAHPQIRSRGTIGGSIAHADPSAELPGVTLALGARYVIRGRNGQRRVAAADFFTGLFATALEPGELLVAIEIPARPARSGTSFMEVARRHGDFGLAGAATEVVLDADGRIAHARLVLLGVSDRPILVDAVASLTGRVPDDKTVADLAEQVREQIDPPSDIHADSRYRRQLAAVLTRRALTLAARRAQAPAS